MQKNQSQDALYATTFSFLSNVVLIFIKFSAGVLGNSYALIADALESATDVVSSFFLILGLKFANRPPDENHPYGHGRLEPLITILMVFFLYVSGAVIVYESIRHIRTPHTSPHLFTLAVISGILVFKEVMYRYLLKKSKTANSSALKAEAWHHRSDALTSLAAFIGILIAIVMGKGYESADDWAALVASGLIFFNGFKLMRTAFSEIMDEHQYDDVIDLIRKAATNVEGIKGTEKCLVRKTGMRYWVDLHALVDGNLSVSKGHELSHKLKDHLLETVPHLQDVLIHIEPV